MLFTGKNWIVAPTRYDTNKYFQTPLSLVEVDEAEVSKMIQVMCYQWLMIINENVYSLSSLRNVNVCFDMVPISADDWTIFFNAQWTFLSQQLVSSRIVIKAKKSIAMKK